MDIKKLSPWNWFSHEDNKQPVRAEPDTVAGQPAGVLQLHEDLERAFNNVLRNFGFPTFSTWPSATQPLFLRPHVDVVSGEREYVITIEVPGVDEKDVKLELAHDGALIISGEKRQEVENKDRNLHRVERTYGSFRRVLSLPDDADRDGLDAYFKNGVLSITCPRIAAVAGTPVKQIEIKKVA
ncbi:Hsp20/alpha crystallin family protein [Asticcacaulis sp.]|uniref:Hsp20/alpha crystallin family protein n=1 Tax=Asticcacaulis sp. TaxID=1872648 RepID=UPI003F7C4CBD